MANIFQKAWNSISSTAKKVGDTIYDVAKKVVTPILDNAGGVMATIAGIATGNSTLTNAGVNSIANNLSGNSTTSTQNISTSSESAEKINLSNTGYKDSTIKYLYYTAKLGDILDEK